MSRQEADVHWSLGKDDEALLGASTWFFSQLEDYRRAFHLPGAEGERDLDRVFTLNHDVAVGDGRTLRVTEHFTVFSWLRPFRKAVLFLNGSVFLGNHWSIPVPGYNWTEMVARRGMFAYTLDFLGTGQSHIPASGIDANRDSNAEAIKKVLETVRVNRSVPRVDLVAEGYGGDVAIRLATDPDQIGKCVMMAMAYREVVAGPSKSPEIRQVLANSENGYFFLPAEAYDLFLETSPRAVREYIHGTQPGTYPIPVIPLETPNFDPTKVRVPGLVLSGAKDFVVSARDCDLLAADYGSSGAKLVVHPEGGHAPRTESPEIAEWCWNETVNFLEAPADQLG